MCATEDAEAHDVRDGEVVSEQPWAGADRVFGGCRGVCEPLSRGRVGGVVSYLLSPAEQRTFEFVHREQDPLVHEPTLVAARTEGSGRRPGRGRRAAGRSRLTRRGGCRHRARRRARGRADVAPDVRGSAGPRERSGLRRTAHRSPRASTARGSSGCGACRRRAASDSSCRLRARARFSRSRPRSRGSCEV